VSPNDIELGEDVRTTSELTEATASGLRWITAARIVTEIGTLASMVVLARNMPPAAFGMFAIAILVQEVALAAPGEGIGAALVQQRSIDRDHLRGGMLAALLLGVLLAIVGLGIAGAVVTPAFGAETGWLVAGACGFFLIGGLYAVPLAMLRRRLDFARISMLDLAATLVRALTSVLLAVLAGWDASALLVGSLAGAAVAMLLATCFAVPPPPAWRPAAMRDLWAYGGPAGLATFCWTGFRNGDYAVIGARLGTAQSGIYWRAFQLAVEYQRKISTVMTQMAFPVLARTGDIDQLTQLRRRMVQLLTVVLFPLLAVLAVLAPQVVPWIFGPAWQPAVLPTQILVGAGVSTLVIDAVGSALQAAGRARTLLAYGVAHFVFYMGVVIVASSYGLVATCCAAVVSHAVFLVIAYMIVPRPAGESALGCLWRDLAPASGSCAGLLAAALPLQFTMGALDAPLLLHIALVSAGAGAGYLGTLWLVFPAAAADLRALARRALYPAARPVVPEPPGDDGKPLLAAEPHLAAASGPTV
jgi:lipopolysaccharide exporter